MGDEKVFATLIDQDGNLIQELTTEPDIAEATHNFSRHMDDVILSSVLMAGISLSRGLGQAFSGAAEAVRRDPSLRDHMELLTANSERFRYRPPVKIVVPNKKAEARKTRREKNRAAGKARLTTKRGK